MPRYPVKDGGAYAGLLKPPVQNHRLLFHQAGFIENSDNDPHQQRRDSNDDRDDDGRPHFITFSQSYA
jgi:hypothetical protein